MAAASAAGAATIDPARETKEFVDAIDNVISKGTWMPFQSTAKKAHNHYYHRTGTNSKWTKYTLIGGGSGAVVGGVVAGLAGAGIGSACTAEKGAAAGAAAGAPAGPPGVVVGAAVGVVAGVLVGGGIGAGVAASKYHNETERSNAYKLWRGDLAHNGVWQALLSHIADTDPLAKGLTCDCGKEHHLWTPDVDSQIRVVEIEGKFYLSRPECRPSVTVGEMFDDPRWQAAAYRRLKERIEPLLTDPGPLDDFAPQYRTWFDAVHRLTLLEGIKGEIKTYIGGEINGVGGCCPKDLADEIRRAYGGKEQVRFSSVLQHNDRVRETS